MIKIAKWPFKSAGNFFITSLGFIGVSFWGYSIYSETKFNQPIIGESVKLLGRHQQVKELVGYPLSYRFSIGNRFVQKDQESYFSFKVNGPKNTINIEMTAGSVPAGQLYSQSPKITQILAKIKQSQQTLAKLDTQRKKSSSLRTKEIDLERASLSTSIKTLKRQLIEQQFQQIQKRQRYFVPSKQLYTRVNTPLSKDSSQPIPSDELLWGVNDLVITLPNRTKMIVYPQPKKTFEQKQAIVKQTPTQNELTIGKLHKKTTIDVSTLSKSQIQEYGSQKTNFMYSKYGSMRMFSSMLFIGLITGIVLYKRRNVLKSIKGSTLQNYAQYRVSKNKIIMNLPQLKGKPIEYDPWVGGGIANNEFKCVLFINNLKFGRIQFEGKYAEDMNDYEFRKMRLKFLDEGQMKSVDLLKQ